MPTRPAARPRRLAAGPVGEDRTGREGGARWTPSAPRRARPACTGTRTSAAATRPGHGADGPRQGRLGPHGRAVGQQGRVARGRCGLVVRVSGPARTRGTAEHEPDHPHTAEARTSTSLIRGQRLRDRVDRACLEQHLPLHRPLPGHYSVAQHSRYWCPYQVPAEHALAGLLHDAAEGLRGRRGQPWKRLLPDYQALETQARRGGRARTVRPAARAPACVKHADLVLLVTEARPDAGL